MAIVGISRSFRLLHSRRVIVRRLPSFSPLKREISELSVGIATGKNEKNNTDCLKVVSWNIAAINNNPFEYWMDSSGTGGGVESARHDNKAAEAEKHISKLMQDVEIFMSGTKYLKHGNNDILVEDVLTPEMFAQLEAHMHGMGWDGTNGTRELYESYFRKRNIVSGFLTDKALGLKRLCSWPDRFTNTIACVDHEGGVLHRPSVINFSFSNDMATMDGCWRKWLEFMFETSLQPKVSGPIQHNVASSLVPLSRIKYPELSAFEESISVPLQTLCLAIFDMSLFHVVNAVAPGRWLTLKKELCASRRNKNRRFLDILQSTYADADVVCIQEAGVSFLEAARTCSAIRDRYSVLWPADAKEAKDQNSLLMLRRETFDVDNVVEVTHDVAAILDTSEGGNPLTGGDLVAVECQGHNGQPFILGSFHGDTNGLATLPMLNALHAVRSPNQRLIMGMDANAHRGNKSKRSLHVADLGAGLRGLRLASSFGDPPDDEMVTTCMARTFLQPQFNKAVLAADRFTLGDCNPKDHIVADRGCFVHGGASRDNTGRGAWTDQSTFPSLQFPSDHAVISARVRV